MIGRVCRLTHTGKARLAVPPVAKLVRRRVLRVVIQAPQSRAAVQKAVDRTVLGYAFKPGIHAELIIGRCLEVGVRVCQCVQRANASLTPRLLIGAGLVVLLPLKLEGLIGGPLLGVGRRLGGFRLLACAIQGRTARNGARGDSRRSNAGKNSHYSLFKNDISTGSYPPRR